MERGVIESLLVCGEITRGLLRRSMRVWGVSLVGVCVLSTLARQPHTVFSLARQLRQTRQRMWQVVDELTRAELIRPVGRFMGAAVMGLTPHGEQTLAVVRDEIEGVEMRLEREFEERELFQVLLERVREDLVHDGPTLAELMRRWA